MNDESSVIAWILFRSGSSEKITTTKHGRYRVIRLVFFKTVFHNELKKSTQSVISVEISFTNDWALKDDWSPCLHAGAQDTRGLVAKVKSHFEFVIRSGHRARLPARHQTNEQLQTRQSSRRSLPWQIFAESLGTPRRNQTRILKERGSIGSQYGPTIGVGPEDSEGNPRVDKRKQEKEEAMKGWRKSRDPIWKRVGQYSR